jgi:hypothetical protein
MTLQQLMEPSSLNDNFPVHIIDPSLLSVIIPPSHHLFIILELTLQPFFSY